jgi:molecular chaperone HtpG
MSAKPQTYSFQAETSRLLDLVIHSLYTHKDIFLRELVSNASDAIDRRRFEALTSPELSDENEKPEIRIDLDPTARTLTIRDTGIGMSRDELVANVGTIARSGTRELRDRIRLEQTSEIADDLIGQFGVGFYSAFMVADRVVVVTRRAGEADATRWESEGRGEFSVQPAERETPGTTVTLFLKPANSELALEDYTDRSVVRRIVKKHSDFVAYPIVLSADGDGKEDTILNSMKPLWTRPQSEVSETDYAEFYKHIAHDWSDPARTMVVRAEGRQEYRALLFIPSKIPFDFYYESFAPGLRLYAKGVLIMERCEELLPRWLRFVRGVVDSADLPLNVSRQMLQQDWHVTQIRKGLTKKILDTLASMAESEQEAYRKIWSEFGVVLKEGVASDFDNRDRVLPLLLFQSSAHASDLTSLSDYVSRFVEGQEEIYYITGETRAVVENSPHVEALRERGYEVLFMTDPIDEFVMQTVPEFEGKKLKSAAKGEFKLGTEEERERVEQELARKKEGLAGLLESLQTTLSDRVSEVRLSSRLTSSPACLVGGEFEMSPHVERLLHRTHGDLPQRRRVLELNPDHEVVTRLQERFDKENDDPEIADYAELLLGYALIAEGSELAEPARFNRVVAKLMAKAL